MFSLINGGFQVTIQNLFTIDLSWLFTTCFMTVSNVSMLGVWLVGKANKIGKKKHG